MSDLKNSYWGKNGKFQEFIDALEERTPKYGFTNNVYVNIYLVMANIYYDTYNNGGANIEDSYAKDFHFRVEPYLEGEVELEPFINEDFVTMEEMMDLAFEFIKDKNLDFPIYSKWCSHDLLSVSEVKPVGELAEKGYWFEATFGEPEEKQCYCNRYKDVTNEFKDISLDSVIRSCEEVSKNGNMIISKGNVNDKER